MWRLLVLVLSGLLLYGLADGQPLTRFNPKAGFSVFKYQDELDLRDRMSHPAFNVGFDVSIREGNWIFTPGFYYQRIGIHPERLSLGKLFSNRRNLHYAHMPVSAGRIFKLGKIIEVMPFVGADLQFFLSIDKNSSNITNPDLKSFQAGGHLGGQVRLADHFTVDLAYVFSLMPSFKSREKSIFRGYTFTFGYLF